MKKTTFTLLAVAVLALVGYCCYWWLDDGLLGRRGWSKEELANLARSGRELRAALNLSEFRGSDECYAWSIPAVVSISNRTFKIDGVESDPKGRAYWFDVRGEANGVFKHVGRCEVVVSPSADDAINYMCDSIMRHQSLSPDGAALFLDVGFDVRRNVLVGHKKIRFKTLSQSTSISLQDKCIVANPENFERTYGNIYLRIRSWECDGLGDLYAKDFALQLLEAGAKR